MGFLFHHDGKAVKLNESDLKPIIDNEMTFPNTSKVKDKELKFARRTISFNCNEKKCYFDQAMELMKSDPELKSFGMEDICEYTVDIIANDQQLFVSKSVNGYVFKSDRTPILFLKNASLTDQEIENSKTGVLDVSEARRKAIEKWSRNNGNSESMWPTSAKLGYFGIGFFSGIMFVLRSRK